MKNKLKKFLKNHGEKLLLLYAIPYCLWFFWLQIRENENVFIIKSWIDDYIPQLEIFVIPYVIWYVYLVGPLLYFCFKSKKDFIRLALMLIIGMTFSLTVYTFWPNGLNLREPFENTNLLTSIVELIRSVDPPVNVCPSMHVYTTIVINTVICTSKPFGKNTALKISSSVLMVFIVMSTVFIKQHSIIDVVASIVLAIVVTLLLPAKRFRENKGLQDAA